VRPKNFAKVANLVGLAIGSEERLRAEDLLASIKILTATIINIREPAKRIGNSQSVRRLIARFPKAKTTAA
jgi:hypothetical protein